MVPSEGVEPPRLAAIGSKPIVSTSSTNWAYLLYHTNHKTILPTLKPVANNLIGFKAEINVRLVRLPQIQA